MNLVHASISENNNSGWDGESKSGDQTGKECCVRTWYDRPWDFALRYPDRIIADKASEIAVKLAKSNLVGYDQSDRNSLYEELKNCNWDVEEYIFTGQKTETDCSAFIYAVYSCLIPVMRYDGNAPTTFTMECDYSDWGFKILKNVNPDNLINGDIVVSTKYHTAMVVEDNRQKKLSRKVDKALTTLAKSVIKGEWGDGENRKENLFFAIQSRVNKLLWK